MLRVVAGMAKQPHVQALCKKAQIALDTWRAITLNDVLDADTATGRGMRTSQVVAAARVGRTPRTVRRARSINVQLGILVELYRGRELGRTERLALLSSQPGHQQRGLPNQYAATVCPPRQRARLSTPRPGAFAQVMIFVHLPPVGGLSLSTHLLKPLPITSANAADDAEPPPAARPGRRRRRPGSALAHEVLAHPQMFLLHRLRPGHIAGQLRPYQHGGWHGHALAEELLTVATRLGIPTWTQAHHPCGLLKSLLTAIDPVAEVHQHTAAGHPDDAPEVGGAPQACGRPECDGHGWINHGDTATRCQHCPPGIRTAWDHTPPALA